jgi:hypothetical protein
MIPLTVRQLQVLEALADYHYLSPAQMVRLGLSTSTASMRQTLQRFAFERPGGNGHRIRNRQAEIGAVKAGVDRDSGRIARIYYLTKHGADLVAEKRQVDPESIFYPRGDKLALADIPHRRMAIDFCIELNFFAARSGHTVECYHHYFRTTGANRGTEADERLRKLTRIDFPEHLAKKYKKPFFWPDGVFVLRTESKRILFLVEAYRGIDTGRVMRQLGWHLVALEHGLPSLRYGFDTANKVLLVFETESAIAAVLNRLLTRTDLEDFRELIACSTIERLQANFLDWHSVQQGNIIAGELL